MTAKYNYRLKWYGKAFLAKYRRAAGDAVAESALRVQKQAKILLNKSGKGVVAKLGLNEVKGAEKLAGKVQTELRLRQGIEKLSGVKTVHGKKGKLTFGGSFGKNSRIYWYREPLHRWVQASQPGMPPHNQTGNLQRIAVQFSKFGLEARIGPQYGLKYARIQELGGRGMVNLPPRPYMRPAYEMVLPKINEIFKKKLGMVSK